MPDLELIGGREKREIVIVDYDPAWPVRFEQERARIDAALGPVARRIEHIGSTAVPGLAAKPIIDVSVSVDDVEDEASFLPQLEAAGYLLRVREPGHRMFRTPELDVHVHLWPAGGEEERRQLVFRDWLRTHPADRDVYASLKRDLATREWRDMNDYADAKGGLIAEIMRRAEESDPRAS